MSTIKSKSKRKVSTKSKVKPQPLIAKEEPAYKVDKNVPIGGVRSITNLNRFPFDQMNIGDSFMIPPDDKHAENPNSIHYAANQYAKMKPGFTVTTRLQLNKFRRVWRIK
jgi:hypothetical protein